MARSGRFGSLPGSSPDLTSTIAALLEQYENARDRNIYSAWLNGGKFEGKKVTDQSLMAFYKMRRSQYTKDDPEYDYWNQQHSQIDYRIGESKMLLRFERNNIKEGGAAAWYASNAKRFPKNSEVWREAMRNAARFQKAAQETRKSSTATMSDSEKYAKANDRIYRQRIAPMEAAVAAWEKALDRNNMSDEADSFMTLGGDKMAKDAEMRQFMRTHAGKSYGKAFKKATGRNFTYKAFKQVLRRGQQGYRQQAGNAKRFGFLSYVPGLNQKAAGVGQYRTQLHVFVDDIYEDYDREFVRFDDEMDDAENALERQAVRDSFKGIFTKIAKRAAKGKRGDHVLAASIDNTQNAIDGKKGVTSARNELMAGGKSGTSKAAASTDPVYETVRITNPDGTQTEVSTSVLDLSQGGDIEDILISAINDKEKIIPGYESDEWMFVKAYDGTLVEVETAEWRKRHSFLPGSSARDNDFIENTVVLAGGVKAKVMLPVQTAMLHLGMANTDPMPVEAVSYKTVHGDIRYQYVGPEGWMQDTAAHPLDWANNFDDGEERTETGHWYDEVNHKIVKVVSDADDQGNMRVNAQFAAYVWGKAIVIYAEKNGFTLDPSTDVYIDKNGKPVEVSQADVMPTFKNMLVAHGTTFDEDGSPIIPGGDLVKTVQVANPAFSKAQAPGSVRPDKDGGALPNRYKTIDYLAGGRTAYDAMSEEDQAAIQAAAFDLNENEDISPATQHLVNAREELGYAYEDGTFIDASRADAEGVVAELPVAQQGPSGLVRLGAAPTAPEVGQAGAVGPSQAVTAQDRWQPPSGRGQASLDLWVRGLEGSDVQAPEATRIPETIDKIITLNAVLTEAGSTLDTSGRIAQYQGTVGRRAAAALTAEERHEIVIEIAVAEGNGDNPDYIYVIAGELDALAAAGDAGLSEREFFDLTGSMSKDERYRAIQQSKRLRASSPDRNRATQDFLSETLLDDLRDAKWSDAQIEESYPVMFAEEKKVNLAKQSSARRFKAGYGPDPALAALGPASGAGPPIIDNAAQTLKNAISGVQMAIPTAAMPMTPASASGNIYADFARTNRRLVLPTATTVKPLVAQQGPSGLVRLGAAPTLAATKPLTAPRSTLRPTLDDGPFPSPSPQRGLGLGDVIPPLTIGRTPFGVENASEGSKEYDY